MPPHGTDGTDGTEGTDGDEAPEDPKHLPILSKYLRGKTYPELLTFSLLIFFYFRT